MTRSQSLKARLASDPAIAALIGSGPDIRMYPVTAAPPKGKDALTYKLDADYEYTNDGIVDVKGGIELHCWSKSYEGSHALADAIFDSIHDYSSRAYGPFGGVGGINVLHCLIDHDEDIYVAITADEGMFDVFVRYELLYTL